jgi:putative flippase GtrA
VRQRVIDFIEFFHLPLFQFIPTQTFRYLFCGVSTVMVDWITYYLAFHFLFNSNTIGLINLGFIHLSPKIISKLISVACSFVWGFALNKYVVFTESTTKGRVQIFRYGVIAASCIVFSIFIIKFLTTQMGVYPTFANVFASLIIAVYSYIIQRKFTFK